MRKILLLIAAICLFSCQKAPFLTLNTPSSITFSEQGGSQDIIFQANRNWSASSSESWCKVSPASGTAAEGSISFKVTCEQNTTYDPRSCTVTIKVEEVTEIITVTQAQNNGLFITTPEYNLSNEAHTLSVDVKENVEFEVVSEVNWIKYIETKGLKTSTITLSVEANDTYDQRVGKVQVKQKNGDLSGTVTVTQEQLDGLFVSPQAFNLSNEEQTIEVKVNYNVSSSIVIPDDAKDWVSLKRSTSTRGLAETRAIFTIARNATYDSRETSITFKQIDGPLAETVVIRQQQSDGLFVTIPEYNISYEAQALNVDLKANIEYEVKPEADWIHIIETRGLKSTTIKLAIEENNSYDSRIGTVIVKQTNGHLEGHITINQAEKTAIILSDKVVHLLEDGGYFEVHLQTNVNYTCYMDEWIHEVKSRGFSEFQHSFICDPLPLTLEKRSGIITFVDDKGNNQEDFLVIQESRIDTILFQDPEVERICLFYYDSNRDGVLSTREAAQTSSLFGFDNNVNIRHFDEMKYFTRVREIGGFYGCSNLETISLPPNITKIGLKAFLGCSNLKGPLEIPDQVEEIGYEAFRGCISLSGELVLPDSLKRIGQEAFQDCHNLIGGLVIPEGVTHIEPFAFAGCSKMSGNLTLNDSLEEIGLAAFSQCSKIQGSLVFPDNLKHIGNSAFSNCSGLNSLVFSDNDSLESIGGNAFINCTGLTGDLLLPDKIEDLPDGCFSGCSGFNGILRLPKNLKHLSATALQGCKGFHGDLIFPDNLESIPQGAFMGFSNFDGILVLPKHLKEIGASAFYGCTGFRGDLIIPEGIETIPELAFYNCSLFENLSLPTTIKTIGRDAFRLCDGFKTVRIAAETPPKCSGVFLDRNYPVTPEYHFGGIIYVHESSIQTYIEDSFWDQYYGRYCVDGHSPQEYIRTSTDFSQDGEVVLLQKATKGKGVNLILMGEGFLDIDMNPGGKYEQVLRKYIDQFFSYEPYHSLRDRFNVYAVKVISENDAFFSKYSKRKFIDDNDGSHIYHPLFDYAKLVPKSQEEPRLTCSAVILNYKYQYGRSFCAFSFSCSPDNSLWDRLTSEAFILEPLDVSPTIINHEMGGHGFALLDDEYTEYNQTITLEDMNELDRNTWAHVNTDYRNDPKTVKWSHFLMDSRYDIEGLGIYEGSNVYFPKGVFRPSMNSLMRRHHTSLNAYNAPSREQIYKTTMILSEGIGWTFNYEEFVRFDAPGRKQAAEAYAMYPPTRSYVERREDFEPGLPPIILDDDNVKEIRVSKNGEVTIIR